MSPHSDRLRAVQWNVEHGNGFDRAAAALRGHPALAEADIVFLEECDLGMARSGNHDVALELAAGLGFHGAWAPLFLETTIGRNEDSALARGAVNEESLYGLAMLSRWPFAGVRVIELPSPERFQFEAEGMYGRHIALIAAIERPGAPFVAVAVHLEVHRTRKHRAAQMRTLLRALGDESRPVIIAGDFNTHTFDRGRPESVLSGARTMLFEPDVALRRRLLFPDRGTMREPLFEALREAGFEWNRFVDREPTLQLRFQRIDEWNAVPAALRTPFTRVLTWAEGRAGLRLDWFAGRGWHGGDGFTVKGLDGPGAPSDHAPIVGEFW